MATDGLGRKLYSSATNNGPYFFASIFFVGVATSTKFAGSVEVKQYQNCLFIPKMSNG